MEYVSFGQCHKHVVHGKLFDKDCLAGATDRETAFKIFGPQFCTTYSEGQVNMEYFPRGVIDVRYAERVRLFMFIKEWVRGMPAIMVMDENGKELTRSEFTMHFEEARRHFGLEDQADVWGEYTIEYGFDGWQLEWVEEPQYHWKLKGLLCETTS